MNDKVVVINAGKMNYDGKLDFSILSPHVETYDDSNAAEFIQRIQGAAAVVTKEYPVPATLIDQFPDSVKVLVEAGTGYNNIDLAACQKKGITVCNIPAYSTQRVAHTAIMLMLNLFSSLQIQIAMLAKGDHRNFTQHLLVPHGELNSKILGIFGTGHIGREVIKIAQALGMQIITCPHTLRADVDGIHFVSKEELLRTSDVVSLHCPLNDQTRHMIDKEALSMMKPTAFIINTARGALIDEPALIQALQNGTIAGAGLDVQETEPPAADNPLYTLPNVIITPHMGWKGLETRQRLVSIIAQDIQGFLNNRPVNVVSSR